MKKSVNRKKLNESSLRNLFALGFVSFFTDMSSEMVFSLIPTFILSLPGSSKAVLGLIEGTAEALSYVLRAVSGILSDKIRKRKLLVFVGYGLSNAVKPLFAIVKAPLEVFAIRVSDRVGKAVRTSPRDALLSESISEKSRGVAFGLHRTLDQAGAILGPLIASAVMLVLGLSIRDVFWLSLVPGTIGLFIILFFVKERGDKPSSKFRMFDGIKNILKGNFTLLLIIFGIFSLGAFNFSFILLYAKEAEIADSVIPLVYALINIAHTAIAIPAGLLSDKIRKEKVMIMGYGIFSFTVILILFLPTNAFNALLVAVLYGTYFGIIETVQRALIPDYVEKPSIGTAYGLYYLVVGSAFFLSNVVVGVLWEHFSSSIASAYCSIISSVAIMSMIIFINKRVQMSTERK